MRKILNKLTADKKYFGRLNEKTFFFSAPQMTPLAFNIRARQLTLKYFLVYKSFETLFSIFKSIYFLIITFRLFIF